MVARGKYVMSQFNPLAKNCKFLVNGYVVGHGAGASPQTQRRYTAFVHTKISRVIGARGIHNGTMSFGNMEDASSDKNISYMLQQSEKGEGMKKTMPIVSRGRNALRLPFLFEKLGHSNVFLPVGGCAFFKEGLKQGATSCRQAEEAWLVWEAGKYGDSRLSDGIVEYAKTHEELKAAFHIFREDADQYYPGWKEQLGYSL